MPILAVEDVHKSFGGLKALNGVSLTVKRGSITGLIGPNGSGKTTLFNCAAGFYETDKGKVFFDGPANYQLFQLLQMFPIALLLHQ